MYILFAILLAIAAFAGWRALIRFRSPRRRVAGGIDEGRFVSIGGIEQWVRIRGESRENPALLFVHGGPGVSYEPFSDAFRGWEKHFTVVLWDQRGAGKSQRGGPMTIERMAEDGVEVAEFLRTHLGKERVILFCHSWGTILGLTMAKRRPDLFEAYVGTGQVVSMALSEPLSYEMLLEQAPQAEKLGPPPYKDMKSWMQKQRLIVMTAPPPPDGRKLPDIFLAALVYPAYSLRDAYHWYVAFGSALKDLYGEFMSFDARSLGATFEVPIFIAQGSRDVQAPCRTVEEFVPTLIAPRVELEVLEGEDHSAVLSNPDAFLRLLLKWCSQGSDL